MAMKPGTGKRRAAGKPGARAAARPASGRGPSGVQLGEDAARGMILLGAARVFADKGVRSASVEDLLEAGRVSRRTFYRLYGSKEDVAQALYDLGTKRLVDACAAAAREEHEPLRLAERFVDAHLRTARELGRLVFVLGGEAQRQESTMHARRMQAHAEIVELLAAKAPDVDRLLFRGLILALEGVTRMMLEEGDEGRKVEPAAVERVRRVMLRMATAAIAGEGPNVTPMPKAT